MTSVPAYYMGQVPDEWDLELNLQVPHDAQNDQRQVEETFINLCLSQHEGQNEHIVSGRSLVASRQHA